MPIMRVLTKISFKKTATFFASLTIFSLAIIGLAAPKADAAGSASLSLSPSSGTFTVGDNVAVRVVENSDGQPVNGVQADLSYDKNALELVSVDSSQSAFPLAGPSSAGNGVVRLSKIIPGSTVTGSQTVAVINFKAKASSGSTAISFLPTSMIAHPASPTESINVWNGNTAGASFGFTGGSPTTPVPGGGNTGGQTPSSPGGGSSSGGGSGSTGQSPSSGGSGTGGGSGGSSSNSGGGSGSSPGDSGVQPAPSGSENQTQPLDPTGSLVAIQVLDASGKPVKGATVTLENGQKVTTDDKGIAGFTNVPEGEQKVKITHDGTTREETINVKNSSGETAFEPQEFKVKLNKAASQGVKPYWIVYGALAVIILGTIGILFPRRPHFATHLHGSSNGSYAQEDSEDQIVVGDFSRHKSPPTTPVNPVINPNQPQPPSEHKPTQFHNLHLNEKPDQESVEGSDDSNKTDEGDKAA